MSRSNTYSKPFSKFLSIFVLRLSLPCLSGEACSPGLHLHVWFEGGTDDVRLRDWDTGWAKAETTNPSYIRPDPQGRRAMVWTGIACTDRPRRTVMSFAAVTSRAGYSIGRGSCLQGTAWRQLNRSICVVKVFIFCSSFSTHSTSSLISSKLST